MAHREKFRATVFEPNPDFPLLSGRRDIAVVGRYAQTLRALVEAGPKGVTALEMSSWALRLGHYIYILRHRDGLNIETINEAHDGDYPGTHGRYVLHSQVELIDADAGDGRAAA